jgi:acyl-CoA reductase-like NAD-dependent aldehyde dehydrogenase
LRGQILYRAAEMLENRRDELASELARSQQISRSKAMREVTDAIDHLVYFAGWTDKFAQVFGTVNPVSSPHFNFTIPEPTGVVVVVAPDEPALLAMVSLVAPVILAGNTAVVLASERYPLAALTFAEIIATSDIPAGVVNILAGRRAELASHIASHFDVNAIVNGSSDSDEVLQGGTAMNLKRYARRDLQKAEWSGRRAGDPYRILDTVEFKTTWHPIGM